MPNRAAVGAAAQPGELRKDEPDPVAALAAGPQLVDDVRVHPGLSVDEPLQIERVACRFHMTTVAQWSNGGCRRRATWHR